MDTNHTTEPFCPFFVWLLVELGAKLTEIPDPRTVVTLENAEIFVPQRLQGSEVVKTKRSNVPTVKIIALIVVVILVCVVGGILVWFCIISKRKQNQTPEWNHENDSSQIQQFSHRTLSTPKKITSNRSIKQASIATTTVSPKQLAHAYSGINVQRNQT
uniref:Uncharacterized protein n=1 Tax=Panagrellus redivivus TaxID=6233 RepID=A0A7E4VEX2_PANRE